MILYLFFPKKKKKKNSSFFFKKKKKKKKMLKLNKDVLFLILEEFQDDIKTLYSCLFVNRTWCQTTVPILWKTPGQHYPTDNVKYKLFNAIISHLSKESREIL